MAGFHLLDLSHGDVPPWLNNMVALTRPLAATMVVAIPAVGAFSIGMVSWWGDPVVAGAMAENSVKFLQGIPDAAYTAIAAISLGYTAGKSIEAIKRKPVPQGPGSPESGPNEAGSGIPVVSPDADVLPDYAQP